MLPNYISPILISDYDYILPEEKIAFFPKEKRDTSKLLVYRNGDIEETIFKNIVNYLPQNACLIYNNTKVIHARIVAYKPSGARIEIFCLEPLSPQTDIAMSFQQKEWTIWKCFVGNAKKWKDSIILKIPYKDTEIDLKIEKREAIGNAYAVKFSWEPSDIPFLEILENSGKIPLPPYISREVQAMDEERYQTIYAEINGSVAAPTAGLHFTESVFESLKRKSIVCDYVTLHVGAGTFKPVQTATLQEHMMHKEQIIIAKEEIERWLTYEHKHIVAVGTTTVRTLESIYGFGLKLLLNKENPFYLSQWELYDLINEIQATKQEALTAILNYMIENHETVISAYTELMITSYYKTRIVKSLITNFHQPKSTLLVLLSSFIGDEWRKMYRYALNHDFRFLSYGDSCLILKDYVENQ